MWLQLGQAGTTHGHKPLARLSHFETWQSCGALFMRTECTGHTRSQQAGFLQQAVAAHLGAELLLSTALPPHQALVQGAAKAGLELQAEVLGGVGHAEELHDTINPARGARGRAWQQQGIQSPRPSCSPPVLWLKHVRSCRCAPLKCRMYLQACQAGDTPATLWLCLASTTTTPSHAPSPVAFIHGDGQVQTSSKNCQAPVLGSHSRARDSPVFIQP